MQIEFNFKIIGDILTPEDTDKIKSIQRTALGPDEFRSRVQEVVKDRMKDLTTSTNAVIDHITNQFKSKFEKEIEEVLK